jgi:hypothetical protein
MLIGEFISSLLEEMEKNNIYFLWQNVLYMLRIEIVLMYIIKKKQRKYILQKSFIKSINKI